MDADIDEFFDYPSSAAIHLSDFLEYLNRNQYTAVLTQLLDMFSDRPLSSEAVTHNEKLAEAYEYYDISSITKINYRSAELGASYGNRNQLPNTDIALYFGGIRKTLYGNNCLLTKHSLFIPEKRLDIFPHVHFVNGARLADISCVMLHYKLTNKALDVTLQNKDGFVAISETYGRFINFILNNPQYQVKQDTAFKFRGVDDLVSREFLFISEQYCDHVRRRAISKCNA